MTNREYLNTLSDIKLYDTWCYLITEFSKNFINSRLGIENWLSREYNPRDWIWKVCC